MYEELEDIILNKPIEEATFLDFCKGTLKQRELKKLKGASLDELKKITGDDDLAGGVFMAFRNSREGYMRIRRVKPSAGEPHEGWTYAFAAGLPLHIDRPDNWYHTSNIRKIEWKKKTFTTLNSTYSFEFLDMDKPKQ